MKLASWIGDLQSKVLKPFREQANPGFSLGAFGKHPGWDDHIDDIGLLTTALLTAKQLLYVNGVGKIIDTSAWDSLPDTDVLPAFDHSFFWFGEPDVLVGRMWASRDRKGRTKYPMVVCAQLQNVSPAFCLPWVVPKLADLERLCREEQDAEQIKLAVAAAEQRLRTQLVDFVARAGATEVGHDELRPHFLRHLRETIGEEGICRVLHAINTQIAAFTQNAHVFKKIDFRMCEASVLPQHLRLPGDSERPTEAVLFWLNWLHKAMMSTTPILVIQPPGSRWLDLILGCPSTKELFCLRASPAAIPLANDVPYSFPDSFREKALGDIEEFCASGPTAALV